MNSTQWIPRKRIEILIDEANEKMSPFKSFGAAALSSLMLACSPQSEHAAAQADNTLHSDTISDDALQQVAARSAPRPEKPLPATLLRLDPAVIPDGSGQARPMAASTMFIPHGWRPQGPGVVWGTQYQCTDYFNFNWRAVAPDGVTMIGLLPQAGWGDDNTGHANTLKPGCTKQPFRTVQAYLQAVAKTMFPDARMLEFRPRREFDQAAVQTPMPGGGITRTHTEAGEIIFAFTQDGRSMRGAITVGVTFSLSQLPVEGMGNLQFLTAAAYPGYVVIAPREKFNLALYDGLGKTLQPNPQWVALVSDFVLKLRRGEQIELGKRQQIWRETSDALGTLITESWNANQASADKRATAVSQALRDVQTFNDPDAAGGSVELSSRYDHAWRLADGSYVLSGDASFEPGRDLGIEGRKLATR